MRRHPAIAYFVMACSISWLAVLPLILHEDVPASWHALGAIGPVAAALVMTVILGGRRALAGFGRSLIRWRVGKIAWLLAISPVFFGLVALALLALVGAPLEGTDAVRSAFHDRAWFTGMFLASLAYGIGEEPGWRGFALPVLEHGRTAFRATMLVTVAWGLWHVPFFFYRYHLGGFGDYIGFYVGLFAGAVWLTFLYNSTGGSTLIVIVWHTLWNAVALIATIIGPGVVALASMMIMVAAFIALKIGGPQRLSWTFRQRMPSPPVPVPS